MYIKHENKNFINKCLHDSCWFSSSLIKKNCIKNERELNIIWKKKKKFHCIALAHTSVFNYDSNWMIGQGLCVVSWSMKKKLLRKYKSSRKILNK